MHEAVCMLPLEGLARGVKKCRETMAEKLLWLLNVFITEVDFDKQRKASFR